MSNRQIVGVKILNPPNGILLGLLASIKKQYVYLVTPLGLKFNLETAIEPQDS